ncbi:related to bifunctional 4-hydroxyphenylacetate degradation enzyme [Ramularia collo-cygni]|uniref:Related to bifunctional 4-hydroxyphenylacetate degradation enzyme n=1 Tax=Ramularia collo-cygni TaxID=112498 RepID=A0A2D3V0L2_9PEZI|nr:related to bifunctional 4-hydroxyphenylacetate degradation enzyme [Ramularia collo-cygni]CZT20255.1 related to bifunctional 4-hydroxyphenylacetate degradation enzyme [Ramularia collo-cygni]
MSEFDALFKFVAKEDQKAYFAPTTCQKDGMSGAQLIGTAVDGYASIDNLRSKTGGSKRTVEKLLAPLPSTTVPIYCVGLNYRSHAAEAKLTVTKYPPLWTKPATSLADPGEDIALDEYLALSLPDYEGELVFVTSKDAKNIQASEADSYILGYTVGNDLSCRFFQLPNNSGGQFFYAKAFDKFAPIGPLLVSTEKYNATSSGQRLSTRVNGQVVQDVELAKDMIFTPAQILAHMSRGTTIPAGTAIMTGTPAGVGAFRSPKTFLQDGDVVEVEIESLGVLRNTIRFENMVWWRRLYIVVQNLGLRLFT